jgi:hopene-associated glycosyltransferase HpnB
MVYPIELALTLLSLAIWVGLLGWRGQFWRSDQTLEPNSLVSPEPWGDIPAVCVVIPARNESALLPITLRSLLNQDYPGSVTIFLVDDHSTDETAAIAQALAMSDPDHSRVIRVIASEPLPKGWTGKLWALEQGIKQAQPLSPDYLLLTDADIEHAPDNVSRLVAKAQRDRLDLVSLMVKLRTQSFWERLLVPAFVFFFQKLYPFRWVNDPTNPMAAAAGGCILLRQSALERCGGIQTVRQALIDDCALAKVIKDQAKLEGGKIWLGLSDDTRSLRAYPSLGSLWEMIARTAFTQLNYSPLLLLGTAVGMILIYVLPPMATVSGILAREWILIITGGMTWLLMTYSYLPTLRLYHCSAVFSLSLPIIALLYTLMTLDSALQHWQGRGGVWKGRSYSTVLSSRS